MQARAAKAEGLVIVKRAMMLRHCHHPTGHLPQSLKKFFWLQAVQVWRAQAECCVIPAPSPWYPTQWASQAGVTHNTEEAGLQSVMGLSKHQVSSLLWLLNELQVCLFALS